MSKIDGYSVYQSYYGNARKTQKEETKQVGKQDAAIAKSSKADKMDRENKVQLSDKAKKLLEELKKKYGIWILLLQIMKVMKKRLLILPEEPKNIVC